MRLSSVWGTLTATQKEAWRVWARNNPVMISPGVVRRVGGAKAFTIVEENRRLAGVALESTVVPAAFSWLPAGQFSIRDAGPFTSNTGYFGLRAELGLEAGTKWFLYGTPPVRADEVRPLRLLRFVGVISPGAMNVNDVTPNMATTYQAVLGSFDGPGADGDWGEDAHYCHMAWAQFGNGQLGPLKIATGQIVVEL